MNKINKNFGKQMVNNKYNDILCMVTHDLKSPMTAVFGALDILALDGLTQKEKNDSIKSARKASKAILKLIDSILVMSKLEAGKEHISLGYVDNLDEHFNDIFHTFKYETKMKKIKFVLKKDDHLPKVYWDIDKLHYHVFNNIISNAIKFTPQGGNIEMEIKNLNNEYVSIEIKDDGIGVEKHKIKTIFDKYETHNNQKTFKGNGLGLFNAYNFIIKHNGNIKLTKGLNKKGIGFLITLPVISYEN